MKTSQLIFLAGFPTVFIVAGLILVFLLIYKKRLKKERDLRKLTEEEVRNFIYGSPIVNPNDPLSFIHGRPFNSSLEIPKTLFEPDENGQLDTDFLGVMMMRGSLRVSYGGKQQVSVKTVNSSVDVDTFKKLLFEIKILGYLEQHENVQSLLGVYTGKIRDRKFPHKHTNYYSGEIWAAFEFCSKGNLLEYLQKHRHIFTNLYNPPPNSTRTPTYVNIPHSALLNSTFSTLELLQFSLGLSSGLNFLTHKNVIHGNLSAKNLMLTESLQVKITGFGNHQFLTEQLKKQQKQQPSECWKWSAVELLLGLKTTCSTETDIWSFGVVLWEIFSLGEDPFSGVKYSEDFMEQIQIGYRMKRPEYSNKAIYAIMLDCWDKNPSKRPSFNGIHTRILQVIDDLKNFVVTP